MGTWVAGERDRRVPIIGMSATPWRCGLGAYFTKLVVGNSIGNMIKQGTLVPIKVFAGTINPDLSRVRKRAGADGDYVEEDLIQVMGDKKLVADIVQTWIEKAEGRPTICFAVDRAHAERLSQEFNANGVPAAFVDCKTPSLMRKETREKMLSGEIKVVANVDVLGLGCDWPEVSCISYCRPTRSEMRWVQNVGRGLRTAPGKTNLIVLDHSETTTRLGLVTQIHHDELDNGRPRINAEVPIELPKTCPKCKYIKPPRLALCPNCGHKTEHHGRPVYVMPGTLQEVDPDEIKEAAIARKLGKEPRDKARVYAQLLWHSRKYGKKDGYAAHRYREIYGVWPQRHSMDWRPYFDAPSMDLAAWMKSRNIRKAKARADGFGYGYMNGKGGDNPIESEIDDTKIKPQFIPGTLLTEEDVEEFQ
jgi:superfamily II DNA/RNA helicase